MAGHGNRRSRPKAPPASVSHADVPASQPVVAEFEAGPIAPEPEPEDRLAAEGEASAMAVAAATVADPVAALHLEPVDLPADVRAPAPAVTPIAAASANPAEEETTMDTTETVQNTAQATQAQATQMFNDVKSRTEDAMGRSARMFEEMNGLAKGNVEALVESSRIAARGFEAMGQDAAENARKAFEGMTQAVRTLSQAKSPTELFKLQGDYARQAFDTMIAQSSRSTETMLKMAGEVAQPISNRMAVAADTMKVSG